jgi:hypothetical protein
MAAVASAEALATTARASKVNRVCDAVRAQLLRGSTSAAPALARYTITLLTTYVKKEPQELESALLLIRSLRDKQKQPNAARGTFRMPAFPHFTTCCATHSLCMCCMPLATDEKAAADAGSSNSRLSGNRERSAEVFGGPLGALKYVIFLADVNRLYDVALGMYDFDLVCVGVAKMCALLAPSFIIYHVSVCR